MSRLPNRSTVRVTAVSTSCSCKLSARIGNAVPPDATTAYAVIESFLRGSADALTAIDHPRGCLSVQGGLACSPRNAGVPGLLCL
jgi:hypothetical protein